MAHPNLVFMGVSGCGKSTVAKIYANRGGFAYIEADEFHPPENVAKMSAGIPLTDADRVPWLTAMSRRLAEGRARGEKMVLTCSALKKSYRDLLRAGDPDVVFVLLDGSEELLGARIGARKGHFMPPTLLRTQLATLERPVPGQEKCLIVSIDQTPEAMADEVARAFAGN